jgi:hypothetical protein
MHFMVLAVLGQFSDSLQFVKEVSLVIWFHQVCIVVATRSLRLDLERSGLKMMRFF